VSVAQLARAEIVVRRLQDHGAVRGAHYQPRNSCHWALHAARDWEYFAQPGKRRYFLIKSMPRITTGLLVMWI